MRLETRPVRFLFPVFALFLVLGSCATHPPLPPAQPISNMQNIAGKWQGTFTTGRGVDSPGVMTITKDGGYKTERPGRTSTGKLSIQDGKAVTSGGSEITLHKGEGKQILYLSTRSGGTGEYTKVK